MKTATHHSSEARQALTTRAKLAPADFVPLAEEKRTHISTALTGWHLLLQPQTLRAHACTETYDPRLSPIRAHGRLLWPVAGIKAVLGVA